MIKFYVLLLSCLFVCGRLAAQTDSLRRAQDSVARVQWRLEGIEEALSLKAWDSLLGTNPSFNFMGRPEAEIMEMHQANPRDTMFYMFLGILFYFALVRIFFEKYFGNLITLFFRVSIRQQ